MMIYRASRQLASYNGIQGLHEVIGIGRDEKQSEVSSIDSVWCDWIFTDIPNIPTEVNKWVEDNEYIGNLHLIDENNNTIIVKTIEQLECE